MPEDDASSVRPEPGSEGPASSRRFYVLAAVFAAEVLLLAAFQAPYRTFDRFAIWDSGGELAIQDLLRRGHLPAVDFGYAYGLLPLLIGRVYYAVAGLTPTAFHVEMLACALLTAWGLARFAQARRVGPAGLALLVLAVPDLLLVIYITLVHSLEQALLTNALAEQARGRRATALALVTACCFVKPSLAFVYGLALVIATVAANRRAGWAAWVRALAPAAITAAVLALVLALAFGPVPLARTVFPRTGMEVYRLNHYGFFRGVGREFWALPNAGLRDYFRYEVGFYVLGTVFLAWGGLSGLWRLARGISMGDRVRDDEVVATCAAVHIGFVVALFGHRGTWTYSLPMLVLGLAALARRDRRHQAVVWLLAAALLVSDRSKAVALLQRWESQAPTAATLGLWASPEERAEWAKALELTRGGRPVLFAMCEGGALLIPGFEPPIGGYFIPGYTLPSEARRKAAQLARAPFIISAHPLDWPGFTFWPEMAAAFEGCDLLYEGRLLRVYRRRPAKAAAGGPDAYAPPEREAPPGASP